MISIRCLEGMSMSKYKQLNQKTRLSLDKIL